jgi:periplasmic protein TonB
MRSPVRALGAILLCAGTASSCTKSNPRQVEAASTPEPKIVHVVVTPSQAPRAEPTWTPDPELVFPIATPTALPSPTPRPTVDISIPSLERPMGGPPGAGGAAGMGRLQLDQPEFKYPVYIERLVMIISLNWFKPAQPVQTRPVVHFQIERDGTITHTRLVTSSGVSRVDRAALRAVIASSPMPPLPAEFGGTRLGVQVVFE